MNKIIFSNAASLNLILPSFLLRSRHASQIGESPLTWVRFSENVDKYIKANQYFQVLRKIYSYHIILDDNAFHICLFILLLIFRFWVLSRIYWFPNKYSRGRKFQLTISSEKVTRVD